MSEFSRPLRIAYVTTYDSRNVRHWSGSGFHIAAALEAQGMEVLRVGPLHEHHSLGMRMRQRIQRHVFNRQHPLDREPTVLDAYARQVEAQLPALHADVVFSPGIVPIAHLMTGLPQVSWTDATFAGVVDTYPEFSRLSKSAIRQGHASERAAMQRNARSIFTSQWAANSAISAYGIAPATIAVIPFGANTSSCVNSTELGQLVSQRLASPLRLLFVGVDWRRKGGPSVMALLRCLRRMGQDVRLTVIGCRPEIPSDLAEVIEVIGFLDKNDAAGRTRLEMEFRRATFLVLLSEHECFGLVLCEACAYALPSLTTNADGIPTIIRDGLNGIADAPGTSPDRMAKRLLETTQNPEHYAALCSQALASYQADFNWEVAGRRVVALLRQVVGSVAH